ncbi:MAG: CHAT domain-containing protein [Alphaproteobacteria bacterium]
MSRFMEDFYKTWLDQKTASDPPAALRAVKLAWHKRGEPAENWAPFVMIGP